MVAALGIIYSVKNVNNYAHHQDE